MLTFTSGTYLDHVSKLEMVFQPLQKEGLNVNVVKSTFAHLTREGTKPQPKKVMAALALESDKSVKELGTFLGLVQTTGIYQRSIVTSLHHLLT